LSDHASTFGHQLAK